jgi:hypothetical protein
MRINPWLAILGAMAFSFSSYHFIILEAGHNSKAVAIAYMAPVLAGIILALRGHLFKGGLLTAIFLGLQINANHYPDHILSMYYCAGCWHRVVHSCFE